MALPKAVVSLMLEGNRTELKEFLTFTDADTDNQVLIKCKAFTRRFYPRFFQEQSASFHDDKNKGRGMSYRPPTPEGLKKKDLIGVAWLVALACQEDGWYLRNDIIWHKPNCQPESVRDRFTVAHEYLFFFTKSERYHFDQEATKEQTANGNGRKNKRTVWSINTEPFPDAHFAVFPKSLVRPCILAGSRVDDIVLDPFYGAGTVGVVSRELGRRCIGIELNREYVDIAHRRISTQKVITL